jgi:ATP-dependent RNA helicase HelY
MTVNLVRNYTREDAHHLLNSSFGQFLADRSVVMLERQLERDRAFLSGYLESMRCDRGDFLEYWRLRERADRIRREARAGRARDTEAATRAALGALRPGDVISLPSARRRGLAVVTSNREGRPAVLTEDRRFFRVNAQDFDQPPQRLARIDVPRSGSARSARYRRDVAATLAALTVRPPRGPTGGGGRVDPRQEAKAAELDRKAAAHPCHGCPDRPKHERWAQRASKLEREVAGLERRIRARTETLGRQFDRVLGVLEELGYVEEFTLAPKGEVLRRIYAEGDVIVAEALDRGLFDGLSGSELAALLSTMVYESRDRNPPRTDIPTGALRDRYRRLSGLWAEIRRLEDAHQVELCRELDPGFMATVFAWAEGKPLEDVLATSGLVAGDFVRSCKQLLDLLRRVESVAAPHVAHAAAAAHTAVNRSVVSYTGLDAAEAAESTPAR